jgi:hypothetical protein
VGRQVTEPDYFLRRHRRVVLFVAMAAWLVNASAFAGEPHRASFGLILPLDCFLSDTCWVANYVDVDPTVAARDFHCDPRTYDGHDGVDFAIRDLGQVRAGVPVLASAAGVVFSVRDGMDDVAVSDQASRDRVSGRECGNGVVIRHAGQWETQYCHLRKGSVRVHKGERVEEGRTIGFVGLSGKTEFPHIHLTVRHAGRVIDPFTGLDRKEGCGKVGAPLWRTDPPTEYEDAALYHVGFSDGPPDIEKVRNGTMAKGNLLPTSPALVLWVDMFGAQTGDRLTFHVVGPDGRLVLEHETIIDRTQARRFEFAGVRRTTDQWPIGRYVGRVTLARVRGEKTIEQRIVRAVLVDG